jgi:hypothetical protein
MWPQYGAKLRKLACAAGLQGSIAAMQKPGKKCRFVDDPQAAF